MPEYIRLLLADSKSVTHTHTDIYIYIYNIKYKLYKNSNRKHFIKVRN